MGWVLRYRTEPGYANSMDLPTHERIFDDREDAMRTAAKLQERDYWTDVVEIDELDEAIEEVKQANILRELTRESERLGLYDIEDNPLRTDKGS